MNRRVAVLLALFVAAAWPLVSPQRAAAQYTCAVAIDLQRKAVLAGTIRDVERPPTDELWMLLKTLSFARTADGNKSVADPRTAESEVLKGAIRVRINGAGQVDLKELRLVRNKNNPDAWVIAPEDVAQILAMRKKTGKQ